MSNRNIKASIDYYNYFIPKRSGLSVRRRKVTNGDPHTICSDIVSLNCQFYNNRLKYVPYYYFYDNSACL